MHSARLRLSSINPWGQTIKMYDKHQIVLRVETMANDVSFFKHHRKVEHRDGNVSRMVAPLRKTIFSLVDLRELLQPQPSDKCAHFVTI